jgi:hypothetical protein
MIRVSSSSMWPGPEVVEQTAACAEEHRDLVDLELVQAAGRERATAQRALAGARALSGPGAVHKHVLAPGSLPGPGHGGRDSRTRK